MTTTTFTSTENCAQGAPRKSRTFTGRGPRTLRGLPPPPPPSWRLLRARYGSAEEGGRGNLRWGINALLSKKRKTNKHVSNPLYTRFTAFIIGCPSPSRAPIRPPQISRSKQTCALPIYLLARRRPPLALLERRRADARADMSSLSGVFGSSCARDRKSVV